MNMRYITAQVEHVARCEDVRWGLEHGDPVVCWVEGLPVFRSRLPARISSLQVRRVLAMNGRDVEGSAT